MSAHFSFTNSLYDDCNLQQKQTESVGPYNWIMDPIYESKSDCFVKQSPFMHNTFKNVPSSVIDTESDLRNQTRILSRCASSRFDPTKLDNCKDCNQCNEGLPCGCSHCKQTKYENNLKECEKSRLIPEYTRVNKPCNIFSGITINRFDPLCDDLQDANKIQSNSYIGTNTRLEIKDAFKNQQVNLIDLKSYKL